MVSIYSMPRRVVVNGSFSRMVQVYSAVVAGSSYGTIALRLMLMAPLDQLVVRWPLAMPYLYVDDLAVQVRGGWRYVSDYICDSIKFLITELEQTQHLPVSRGPKDKSKFLTAHLQLARAVDVAMAELGVSHVKVGKLLGVDRRTCGTQPRKTRTKRLGILRHRLEKLKAYKRAGARVATVARTGLKPALTYGVKCVGLDDIAWQQLRIAISACLPGSSSFISPRRCWL